MYLLYRCHFPFCFDSYAAGLWGDHTRASWHVCLSISIPLSLDPFVCPAVPSSVFRVFRLSHQHTRTTHSVCIGPFLIHSMNRRNRSTGVIWHFDNPFFFFLGIACNRSRIMMRLFCFLCRFLGVQLCSMLMDEMLLYMQLCSVWMAAVLSFFYFVFFACVW